jgi:SPP1 family predicted phage head-tail adaptor
MNLGKINKRVTIYTPGTYTADMFGGFTEGAQTTRVVWAGAEQLSQRELLIYGLPVGSDSFKFTFRYETASAMTQQNKINYNGRMYRIISVNNIGEDKKVIEVIGNSQTN